MTLSPFKAKALGFALATASLLGACGSSSEGSATSIVDADSGAQSAPAQVTNVLATSSGGQLDFGDLAGKDAILWFWAPW